MIAEHPRPRRRGELSLIRQVQSRLEHSRSPRDADGGKMKSHIQRLTMATRTLPVPIPMYHSASSSTFFHPSWIWISAFGKRHPRTKPGHHSKIPQKASSVPSGASTATPTLSQRTPKTGIPSFCYLCVPTSRRFSCSHISLTQDALKAGV